jgi:hypothetical protein
MKIVLIMASGITFLFHGLVIVELQSLKYRDKMQTLWCRLAALRTCSDVVVVVFYRLGRLICLMGLVFSDLKR